MKSKASVRHQSRAIVRSLKVLLIVVGIMVALSGRSPAHSRLPFIGTRVFCHDPSKETTTVSIRRDGFTVVKTNLWNPRRETFSGKLDAKGILKRSSDGYYIQIKSASDIVMVGEQIEPAKLCEPSTEKKPQ